MEKENIYFFAEENKIREEREENIVWRRNAYTLAEEKKKEANVWKREIFFWAGVGKYLEKENIFICGGGEKQKRKGRNTFGEGKSIFCE